jgi:hypothetical protein
MTPIRALAPDQRAVLELLLRQGRSYAELSELLGIPEDAVRTRAHSALATLAPDRPAPVGEGGAVADWILGQQDEDEAAGTRAALARTPAWRAWAIDVTDRLAEVEGAEVPDVPDAEEDETPPPATPKAAAKPAKAKPGAARPRPVRDAAGARERPAREAAGARPRPVRAAAAAPPRDRQEDDETAAVSPARPLRSSKLGGALLLGALAVAVGLVLVLFVFDGDDDDEPSASDATPTPTATAEPEVVNEIVLQGQGNRAQGLMRVFRRQEDGRLVFALAADNVPPNRRNEVYAVWFTRQGGGARNLGFSQTPVGEDGVFTTGGPQQGQETDFARWLADYDNVVVARASADTASARRPGRVVLRGRLPGGQ